MGATGAKGIGGFMSIESGIVTKLTSAATNAGSRIYPLVSPHGAAFPHLLYQRITTLRINSHDGPSGLANPSFQVTCIATTHLAASTLADQVRQALDGDASTWDDTVVGACFCENEVDLGGEQASGDADFIYSIAMDFSIWHEET